MKMIVQNMLFLKETKRRGREVVVMSLFFYKAEERRTFDLTNGSQQATIDRSIEVFESD